MFTEKNRCKLRQLPKAIQCCDFRVGKQAYPPYG